MQQIASGKHGMTNFLQDLRFALRTLRKSPGFSAVAVIVLALGIGANTAIFSVVNAVLLQPLPFRDSDRLVRLWHTPPKNAFPGMTTFAVSAANFVDWQRLNHVFEPMTIYEYRGFNRTGTTQPENLRAAAVSSGFFSTLQVQPLLGRVFTPDEDQLGYNSVVVLSHRYWQSHFGGAPDIIGRNIDLDGHSYSVVGVMPPKMVLPDWADIWTPLAWSDKEREVRGEHHAAVIARLKPGVDLPQAQAEMNAISSQLEQQYPADDKGWGAVVLPLHEDMVRDVRPALLVLLGAVAFVLLIACANVANLVLARTLERRKDVAIRVALGAGRTRVLGRVLSETIVLAVTGGVLGLLLAHFGIRLIAAFLGDNLPRSIELRIDGWVLGFTLTVSLLTGILAGLLPALRLANADPANALKQGLGRTDAASGGVGTRNVLVVSEVALSLILLVGAGLLIRTLWQLRAVNPGFDPQGVLTMHVSVSGKKFPTPERQVNFFHQVLGRLRALPGVESAGAIDDLPLDGGGSHQPVTIEGQPQLPMSEQPEVDVRLVSPGYLKTMRIPLLKGRDFNDADVPGRTAAVLVGESMTKRFWPNEDPIGKRLTLTFFPGITREVVGVVGDVKLEALNETRPTALLYANLAQMTAPATGDWRSFGMTIAVRSIPDPTSIASAATNAIHDVDRETPVLDIRTMMSVVGESLTQQRFNMLLLASFAALAMVLAAVGIYSVLAYAVRQRVREIGIRIALGARLSDVLRLILAQGMKPTVLGLVIGLGGSLALGHVLSSLVFGVSVRDFTTLGFVSLLLLAVGFMASLIPAWRATTVDPMRTLRDE